MSWTSLIMFFTHMSYSIQKIISANYVHVCLFQLHDLQHEILKQFNHLQELFFMNIFPLDILNKQ